MQTPPPDWPAHLPYNPNPQPPPLPANLGIVGYQGPPPAYGKQFPDGNWYMYRYDVFLKCSTKDVTFTIQDYSNFDFDEAIRGAEPDSQIIHDGWLILNSNRVPISEIAFIRKTVVPVDVEHASRV